MLFCVDFKVFVCSFVYFFNQIRDWGVELRAIRPCRQHICYDEIKIHANTHERAFGPKVPEL